MKYMPIAFVLLFFAQLTFACSGLTPDKQTIKDYSGQTTIYLGKMENVRLIDDANGYSKNVIEDSVGPPNFNETKKMELIKN